MILKIHRGAREIGGSCVELSSGGSRIIVDLGMPLVDKGGQRFEIKDYDDLSGPELVQAGVLPDIPGLYRWDPSEAKVDGLLISHPHIDHFGFFGHVHPEVPFYLGKATNKLIHLSTLFTPLTGDLQNPRLFQNQRPFACGGFQVTPFLMDHSAFDSYAFLIEAEGKKLIYSGDFREHGRKPGALPRFLKAAPKGVDAMLLEGTTLGRSQERYRNEGEIEEASVTLLKGRDKIALLCFSAQNIDRLVSFYRASLKTGRLFVIDVYTANVLDTLKDCAKLPHPSEDYGNMRVMFPYWLCNRLSRQGLEALMYKFRGYKITKEEIGVHAQDAAMMVRASMLKDLHHIAGLDGGLFIYSLWEGYLVDPSMAQLIKFVEGKNMTIHKIHTSGHARIETLQRVVDHLKPKEVIPIHTFHPEQYNRLATNVRRCPDGQVYQI